MSATKIYASCFKEHEQVLAAVQSVCAGPLERLAQCCSDRSLAGGKILFFGNGGSAADAQHLAAELHDSLRLESACSGGYRPYYRFVSLNRLRQ